jgi:hypothetical protein
MVGYGRHMLREFMLGTRGAKSPSFKAIERKGAKGDGKDGPSTVSIEMLTGRSIQHLNDGV